MANEKMTVPSVHKNSTSSSKLLEIKRDYNVPLNLLFTVFTNAEALKKWWWPKGLHTDRVEIDFREGGKYFFNMKGSDVGGGGMTGQFEKIVSNQLIVMTDQFADENGRPIAAAQANIGGVWPEMIYITFEFASLSDRRSSFTLFQEGIPNEMQTECIQGWNESFDKLARYLEH